MPHVIIAPAPGHAGVAELVDAPDSKSGAPKGACRFEPDLRYRYLRGKVANKEKPPVRTPWAFDTTLTPPG